MLAVATFTGVVVEPEVEMEADIVGRNYVIMYRE